MYKNFTKQLFTSLLLLAIAPVSINALARDVDDIASAINMAGKQRMLSQKIAKAYFFVGLGIRPDKTTKQLKEAIAEFNSNHKQLKNAITNKNIQDMLAFIEFSKEEYESLIKEKYGKDIGALILDYSETLLEGSQNIVKQLTETSNFKKAAIVDISGRQRMLTQRIAKYYIAYQAGHHDNNTVEQLKIAVREFESAQNKLLKNKQNTPQINAELKKVEKLWNIVRKFYMNVEKGGLPVIVLSTSDNIMMSMNRITHMYVKSLAVSNPG